MTTGERFSRADATVARAADRTTAGFARDRSPRACATITIAADHATGSLAHDPTLRGTTIACSADHATGSFAHDPTLCGTTIACSADHATGSFAHERSRRPDRRALRLVRAALSAAWCWLSPLGAAAQQPAEAVDPTVHARESFEAGVAHYEAGHFADALANFQEAYRVKPHPLVRVNIANCYDKLGKPVEALENFQAFLDAAEGAPAQREEVRNAVAELEQRVGRVELKVEPEGAQISFDDEPPLRAPLTEPVVLAVGQHRFAVKLPGYESAARFVDVKPRESVALQIELAPLHAPATLAEATPPPTAAAVMAPPPTAAKGPAHNGYENVWIAGSVTFALAVTSVVTGQLALAANREFDSNLNAVRNPMLSEFQRAGAWARGVDSANRADALAITTDVLLGMTLVSAGLTTYFFLSSKPDAETPQVSAGLGRVTLRAHF